MENREVTLADIASKMQVSPATVSKALSGRRGVSKELRSRVLQTAEELGYRRTEPSAKHVQRRMKKVGVLVGENFYGRERSYYAKMYGELRDEALASNWSCELELLTPQMEKSRAMPKLLGEGLIDGLIILGPLEAGYFSAVAEKSSVPFVCLDAADEKHEYDCVVTDNYYGMYRMTRYLLEKGHRKISFVGTVGSTDSITDRYYGYLKAMEEAGISTSRRDVIPDRDTREGKNYELKLPETEDMPTAFACNCDLTAAAVIRLLEERGLKVPGDISVVGFDAWLYPGTCDVAVTSYENDIREMAARSLYILRHKVEGRYYKKGVSIIEGRLVELQSVRELTSAERHA